MLSNTQHSYGLISKLLHWLNALLVLLLLAVGSYMVELSDEDVWYYRCLDFHQALGIFVWLLFWLSLIWRFVSPPPQALPEARLWAKFLRRLVHGAFKIILLVQPVLGYLFITSWGDPIEIYGMFEIPSVSQFSKDVREWLIDAHAYLAYFFAALLILHIAAALIQQFFLHKPVLKRMF